MNFSNNDKQALISEKARIFAKITILTTGDVFTEDDSLSDFNYEDFRYVPDQGFIGQFVERLMDITLKDIPVDTSIVDEEINLQIGIKNEIYDTTTFYDLGNFIVTKVGDTDTTGNVKIESADYTKKFNKTFDSPIPHLPILAMDLAQTVCDEVNVGIASDGNAYYYIHNSDTDLPIGTYSFACEDKMYTFTTTAILHKNDVLYLKVKNDVIIQKIVNSSTFEITRSTITPNEAEIENIYGVTYDIDNTNNNVRIKDIKLYGRTVQSENDLSDISTITGEIVLSFGSESVTIDIDDEELCSLPDEILHNTEKIYDSSISDEDIILNDDYAADILIIDGITGKITKKEYIGKIDSYAGEVISGAYISSTGSLTTGATVYYELEEPIIKDLGTITLPELPQEVFTFSNDLSLTNEMDILVYESSAYGVGTVLEGISCDYVDFINNDFVITSWQYDTSDPCRKIMQDIGKLAYSWVRTGEDNLVHIDFTQMSESAVDEYNTITVDDYYKLTTEPKYIGPINRVGIGMSDVDGETIYKDDGVVTDVHEIVIYDNNLTNTQELRAIALNGCENLFGLTYMPLAVETTGHPWLKGNDLIKVQTLNDDYVYTYSFDRKLSYKGYIKSEISSSGKNSVQSEFEYKSDVIQAIKQTKFEVDKDAQKITALVENTTENTSSISTITQTVSNLSVNLSETTKQTAENASATDALSTSVGGLQQQVNDNYTYFQTNYSSLDNSVKGLQALYGTTGGSNLIKNSVWFYNDNNLPTDWDIADNTEYKGGEDASLIGVTVSRGKFAIRNGSAKTSETNIEGIIPGSRLNLSYKYINGEYTTSTVKLYEGTDTTGTPIWTESYTTANSDYKTDSVSFVAEVSSYTIVFTSTTTIDGSLTISDLMLNYGDAKNWELAKGETFGAVIKMNDKGIQVTSDTANTETYMTTNGFQVWNKRAGEKITDLTDNGIVTKNMTATGDIIHNDMIHTIVRSGGYDVYVEYIQD